MISRFYDPSLGTISLDGRDIRSLSLSEYRSHIALVAQDAVLYEVSDLSDYMRGVFLTPLRAPSAKTSPWEKRQYLRSKSSAPVVIQTSLTLSIRCLKASIRTSGSKGPR